MKSRTLVISGPHLPRYEGYDEDTEQVAINAIATVTGKTIDRSMILNCHRQGKEKKLIYLE